jgi:phage/plasmid-associated DNA primase
VIEALMPLVTVPARVWDSDPNLIGVQNSVVNVTTGELEPGRPKQDIREVFDIEFDPAAACPLWDRCVSEWFEGCEWHELVTQKVVKFGMNVWEPVPVYHRRAEAVAQFQRLIGSKRARRVRDHVLLVLYGPSAHNGNSTIIMVLAAVFGDLLAGKVPKSLLVRSDEHGKADPFLLSLNLNAPTPKPKTA